MKDKLFKNIFWIICVLLVVVFTFPLIAKKVNYGLDLQGGFEILYKVESLKEGEEVTDLFNFS